MLFNCYVICVIFCWSLFVILSVFLWTLLCLSFFELPLWYRQALLDILIDKIDIPLQLMKTLKSVFCVVFCRWLLVFLYLFICSWYCLSFSIYGFWFPLWYLQTFLQTFYIPFYLKSKHATNLGVLLHLKCGVWLELWQKEM